MKNHPCLILPLALLLFLAGDLRAHAENKTTPGVVKNNTGVGTIQSVFVLPSSPKEGRDPFYPESTRTLQITPAAVHAVEITSLRVPGITGEPGHLLAIINNHTFAVGDVGDVMTPAGRVTVRCLEIQADHVVVEINGQPHRINLESK